MRKILISALLAASLLVGCGSNVSREVNNATGQQSESDIVEDPSHDNATISESGENDVVSESDGNSLDGGNLDSNGSGMVNATASGKRIVCWGDSLTEGTGGGGVTYPQVIEELTGIETLNYGVYGEISSLIAARQGGNPQHVEEISEIPAGVEPVELRIRGDISNSVESWLTFGNAGINPCMIAGVMGELTLAEDGSCRYFTRLEPGEAVSINNDNDTFYTHGMLDARDTDILVIWSGSNDGYLEGVTSQMPIDNIKSMLEYSGCTEYVILDYETVVIGDRLDAWNNDLRAAFGEHVLDIREYLLEHGLEDAGIEPTQGDIEDIKAGLMPRSIMSDENHGTGDFYRIVGEQIVEKMKTLGYL